MDDFCDNTDGDATVLVSVCRVVDGEDVVDVSSDVTEGGVTVLVVVR